MKTGYYIVSSDNHYDFITQLFKENGIRWRKHGNIDSFDPRETDLFNDYPITFLFEEKYGYDLLSWIPFAHTDDSYPRFHVSDLMASNARHNRPDYKVWDNNTNDWFKPTYSPDKGVFEDLVINLNGTLALINGTEKICESVFPDRFILVPFTHITNNHGLKFYQGDILYLKERSVNGDLYEFYLQVFQDKWGRWRAEGHQTTDTSYAAKYNLYDIRNKCTVVSSIYKDPNHMIKDIKEDKS